MKLRKRLILKLVTGFLLLLVAAIATIIIRDFLYLRNPQSALPNFKVTYSSERVQLPVEHVKLNSFSWRLLGKPYEWEDPDKTSWLLLEGGPLLPGTEIEMGFSYPCQTLKVSIASEADLHFAPVFYYNPDDVNQQEKIEKARKNQEEIYPGSEQGKNFPKSSCVLNIPLEPGDYYYKVEAGWGFRGSALYYVKIRVPEQE